MVVAEVKIKWGYDSFMEQEFVPSLQIGRDESSDPISEDNKISSHCLLSDFSAVWPQEELESGINAWHIATSHDLLHKHDIDECPYN